jgi:hypothetical protein
MEVSHLNKKWSKLKADNIIGFRTLRISAECIPELFLALDGNGNRCLLLRAKTNTDYDIDSSDKENIAIEFVPERHLIVLRLISVEYSELFNELILSLYNRIKEISDSATSVKELICSYAKWSAFFSDKVKKRLSEESLKGLFGELVFLKELIENAPPSEVNRFLSAWKGPYDAVHDFEFPDNDMEVKTKDINSSSITISSEYQLQTKAGKSLQLHVVDVKQDENGCSISALLLMIRQLVIGRAGQLSTLLNALIEKGITYQNCAEYDHLRFLPVQIRTFDPDHPSFPKITKNLLSPAVTHVTYSIEISLIEPFLTRKHLCDGYQRVSEIPARTA